MKRGEGEKILPWLWFNIRFGVILLWAIPATLFMEWRQRREGR